MGGQVNGTSMEDVQLMRGSHPELEKYEGLFLPEIGRMTNCSTNEAYLTIAEISKETLLVFFT